jgi:murein DD-endopeptidase MepM/ murein hydrolase activator NlpD
MMRLAAIAAVAFVTWLVAATQVPSHERLSVASVVIGAIVSQPFGCTGLELEPFDPHCPTLHFHTGVDLAAPLGTDVYSATAGKAYVGYDPAGAGIYVEVVTDPHVRLIYCHLSESRVSSGQEVAPGQLIGLVGSTGLATGPHVHLQVDVDGTPVDPMTFLAS